MKKIIILVLSVLLLVSAGVLVACKDDEAAKATLKLDKSSVNIMVGEAVTLKATYEEGSVFTWSSDNEDVATVDETGRIAAFLAGTCEITVRSEDQAAVCSVTVTDRPSTADKIILLTHSELKVELNDKSAKLDAVTFNLGPVVWNSSDQSVLLVDATGALTPVSAGEATITASSEGLSATCKVTVYKKPVLIIEKLNGYLLKGDNTELNYKFLVDGIEGDESLLTWESSNEQVVKVQKGVVTAVGGGEARITARYEGYSASVQCEVRIPIRTADDFNAIKTSEKDANGNIISKFVLMNDIDFGGATVPVICPYYSGSVFTDNMFNGEFDGRGHKLSNFKVANGSLSTLFGMVGADGVIKNTTFEMENQNPTQTDTYKGVVAVINFGKISDCAINLHIVTTIGTNENNPLGSVVFDNRGTLERCIVNMKIDKNEEVKVSQIGALVGKHIRTGASVSDCMVLVDYDGSIELNLAGQTTVDTPIVNSGVFYTEESFLTADFTEFSREIWNFEGGMPALIPQA